MKRIFAAVLAVVCIAVLERAPSSGTDVAKLQPVELLRIGYYGGYISVETDTGDLGIGRDLDSAFRDLKESAPGEIFLDTADHILVSDTACGLLLQLTDFLRPACAVCIDRSNSAMEDAAEFLNIHRSMVTLRDCGFAETELPVLISKGERLYLE